LGVVVVNSNRNRNEYQQNIAITPDVLKHTSILFLKCTELFSDILKFNDSYS